jgi:hypothetical protein
MSAPSYPNLIWAFKCNKKLLRQLSQAYANNKRFFPYLENLIQGLRKNCCSNIQKKIKDADNIPKFFSVLSELKIAHLLTSHGKKVKLLPDNYLSGKSPDLIARDSEWEPYIEVKRLTEDEASNILLEELRKFLNTLSINVRVDVKLKHKLSMPTTTRKRRQVKLKRARSAIATFKRKISRINLSKLPITIDVREAIFEVHSSQSKSFVGAIDTSLVTVPTNMLIKKIRRDVADKAAKRLSWKRREPRRLYIVAIDCDQPWIDEDDVEEALIGHKVAVHRNVPLPSLKPIWGVKRSIKKGWKTYLMKKSIIPNSRTYVDPGKKGAFLSERVMKNVSGVLVRFTNGSFIFMPNPFAYDEINDPKLATYL